ncbi:hypothetical protein D3C85_1374530 [compost metagenome]
MGIYFVGLIQLVDANDFRLRHVLIRKSNTFAPQASVLKATERHGIETIIEIMARLPSPAGKGNLQESRGL